MNDPLVSVVIESGPRRARYRVTARLLGRLTRTDGKATAAEVEVLGSGRITLVPIREVDAPNSAAIERMKDAGPGPLRASKVAR